MGIGDRLKDLREKKNMTLKQVGDKLGFTPTAISCYEHDKRNPSLEVIQKLADLYNTTSDEILGIKNENNTNFKSILNSTNLHWDGIPLREDELNFIKQFLELRVKDKEEHEKKNHEKKSIS